MALRKAFDQANTGVAHPDAYHVIGPVTINPPVKVVEFHMWTYRDANAYSAGLDPVIPPRYFAIQGADWDTLVAIKNGQIPAMAVLRKALYAYAKQQVVFAAAEDVDNE